MDSSNIYQNDDSEAISDSKAQSFQSLIVNFCNKEDWSIEEKEKETEELRQESLLYWFYVYSFVKTERSDMDNTCNTLRTKS